ncbi:sulfatase-like hydrolase/transferase, partial [bacterium]|nr:sulfatase-like hydrolase/transferase [Verrucomicrobiota bacterium]MDB4762057.1 sulfatase-like hydrolase/transferase [bacterium]
MFEAGELAVGGDGKVNSPDIFIIMVESTRQDAIAPEHAPFLSDFRDNECQKIGKTWASSNSTALSWYGLFHGALPVFWAGDKAKSVSESKLETPFWFLDLQQAKYRMEIRTVCDLSYRNMGSTSFGTNQGLFEVYEQSLAGDIHWQDYYDQIPQREKAAFTSAMEALKVAPSGGNFHFIALDSTHYGYRWHEDFEPPYSDFHDEAGVPGFPSDEDIASIKRRYHNSVAWVDFQVKEFVEELKNQGRYDNSVIIVTGDHGEEFYENGSWFHSSSLLPAQTQVPILIKWPKGVEAPPQASASHLDLLPSLRDLLELPKVPGMLGCSLLKASGAERTQMSFACNTGVSGVCMAWYRDGWVATFVWENPFSYGPPEEIHLDDIIGPDGSVLTQEKPSEWLALLSEKFPDAPERLFSKFNLATEGP